MGEIPILGKIWYADQLELRQIVVENLKQLSQITPEGEDPEEWWINYWTEGAPSSPKRIAKHVDVLYKFLGLSGNLIRDVPVGCISRLGINAGVAPVPSGGNVIFIEFGALSQLATVNVLHLKLTSLENQSPRERLKWYSLLYKQGSALRNKELNEIIDLSSFSQLEIESAETHAIIQLYFLLLHEFGHIVLGHTDKIRHTSVKTQQAPNNKVPIAVIERSHERELAADKFAAECIKNIDSVLGFSCLEHLSFSLSSLFETQRFPWVSQGRTEFSSATHPDPKARLEKLIPIIYGLESEEILERTLILADRLDWGASVGRMVVSLPIRSKDAYRPPGTEGQIMLIGYLLAVWGSYALECHEAELLHEFILRMKNDTTAEGEDKRLREETLDSYFSDLNGNQAVEAALNELLRKKSECSQEVKNLGRILGLSGENPSSLDAPLFKPGTSHIPLNPSISINQLVEERIMEYSTRLSKGYTKRFGKDKTLFGHIGGQLGIARFKCTVLKQMIQNVKVVGDMGGIGVYENSLKMAQRSLNESENPLIRKRLEEAIGQMSSGIEHMRSQVELETKQFKEMREEITESAMTALGLWFKLKERAKKQWTEESDSLVNGILGERIIELANRPKISAEDMQEAAKLLDDLILVISHDIK